MAAEQAVLSRSWLVGRYTVTMTVPPIVAGQVRSVAIEWSPDQPRRLTDAEIEQYRRGRNDAIQALGLKALVIDL